MEKGSKRLKDLHHFDDYREQHKITSLFDRIAKHYDLLNYVLSFGQDRRWRRAMVRWMREVGNRCDRGLSACRILDVATGTGDVLFAACKQGQIYDELIGVDVSENMLQQARKKAQKRDLSWIDFILADARSLPVDSERFDCVMIAFGLRNVQGRDQAIYEFQRVLKSDGSLLVLEFFPPRKSLLYSLFQLYFSKVMPVIAGCFSPRQDYVYLPQSVKQFISFVDFKEEMHKQGFIYQRHRDFIFGMCTLAEFQKIKVIP